MTDQWSKIGGRRNDKLTKTIGINILNFNCLVDQDCHNTFRLLNVKTGTEFTDHLEIHFIELEKYTGDIETVKSALDRLIVFLTRAHEFSRSKIPRTLGEVTSIARAIEILDTMGLSSDKREVYEARLKWLRDEEMAIFTAHKRGIDKGRAEGIAEGRAEGIAKGRAEGRAEGMAEGLAKALSRLIDAGMSEEQAKKLLGLD